VELIDPISPSGVFEYGLPPSKSHMIRELMLASKAKTNTEITFNGIPGEDIITMGNCLKLFGVKILKKKGKWIVNPPRYGLIQPNITVDCGNSGTVAKIMSVVAATFESEITIDGDASLRKRSNAELAECLRKMGCEVSDDNFPCKIKGPIRIWNDLDVDVSRSSQPITALILSSSNFLKKLNVKLLGKKVSEGYLNLTLELARNWGFKGELSNGIIELSKWKVKSPGKVKIPSEISLYPMAILLDKLHRNLEVKIRKDDPDNLLLSTLDEIENNVNGTLDLGNASDIISPAAALMAISEGGEITGVEHSRGKESDRIFRTCELLNEFSMKCEPRKDGIKLIGRTLPKRPERVIKTHMDHRLAMTAVILATRCGAEIDDLGIIKITHPEFMNMINSLR